MTSPTLTAASTDKPQALTRVCSWLQLSIVDSGSYIRIRHAVAPLPNEDHSIRRTPSLIERTNRSAWAFRFGDRCRSRSTLVPLSRISRRNCSANGVGQAVPLRAAVVLIVRYSSWPISDTHDPCRMAAVESRQVGLGSTRSCQCVSASMALGYRVHRLDMRSWSRLQSEKAADHPAPFHDAMKNKHYTSRHFP